MYKFSKYGLYIVISLLMGCSATYNMTRTDTHKSPPKLTRGETVYVALSEPGGVESINKIYPDSGLQTSAEIENTLTKYNSIVVRGKQPEAYEAALTSARKVSARYLVLPEVQHWEDRATEWSGKPDRIIVKIWVIDVTSGDLLDVIDIKGKSKWATFGGDHPQDLLEKPIGDYFSSLFTQ